MNKLELENVLQQMSGEGWDFLSALEQRFGASPEARKAREKAALDQQMLAEIAARIFSGDDGERFLRWLLDMTWGRLTFAVASHPDPQQALVYGAFREGQNALALTILGMVAKGRSEEAPPARE